MDAGADHLLREEISLKRDARPKFMKGVVVLQIPGDPPTNAVEIGDLYVPEPIQRTCNLCSKPGHVRKDCPQREASIICRFCSNKGHMKKDCPDYVCSNCKEQGHMSRQCPLPKSEKPTACFNCGEMGHKSRQCPRPKPKKPVECANCGNTSHLLRDCSGPCGNCGDAEHQIDLCTQGTPESSKVNANASIEVAQKKVGEATWEGADVAMADTNASFEVAQTKVGEATWEGADVAMTQSDNQAAQNTKGEATQHTNDKPANKTAASDAGTDIAEPLGGLEVPTTEELSVKLLTLVDPKHITYCSLQFQASYPVDKGVDKLTHKRSVVRFTAKNVQNGGITVEQVEPTSPDIQQLLSEDKLRQFKVLTSDGHSKRLRLYHISMTVSNKHLLGESFYANSDFGPFTSTLYRARDTLQHNSEVVVHFFVADGEWVEGLLHDASESMKEQQASNPILDWYPARRFNVQKGMELPPTERPQYTLLPRYQFDDTTEYLTVQFYSALSSAELSGENPRVETTLRAVRFPGGGDRVYLAALEQVPELHLRPDSVVSVSFFGEDADTSSDWHMRIVDSLPFISGYDVGGFLFRARKQKNSFVGVPEEFHGRTLNSIEYDTSDDLANALFNAPGTVCHVREHVPMVSMNREINTLRYMSQNGDTYTHEKRLLLANDLRTFDKYNLFGPEEARFGVERVAAVRNTVAANLSDEQREVFNSLEGMVGGLKLIQGPGGTGKSELLCAVTEYLYTVYSAVGEGARVNILSGLNQQLNEIAKKTYGRLMKVYSDGGCKGKHPIVVRRHMRTTEAKVYKQDAKDNRSANGVDGVAPYYQEGDETDIATLGMALQIRRTYEDSNATGFDTRLKEVKLSEGTWLLRLAGVPDKDGNLHPIANPGKYSEFLSYLERFRLGELTTREDRMNLTLAANKAMADLASMTDVTCMTPDVASQARSYGIAGAPRVNLHDEAGKMTEQGALAGFVWSKFKKNDSKAEQGDVEMQTDSTVKESAVDGSIKSQPRVVVPTILSGDIHQPNPITGRGPAGAFSEQRSVSLFARLLQCGADSSWLWEQHRYVECITELLNTLLPDGRLRTAPEVSARPEAQGVATAINAILDVTKPIAFIATDGRERKNTVTHSRLNEENVNRCMWMILSLLADGIQPETIGIGVFYKAQLCLYIAALYALEEWCRKQPKESTFYELADSIHSIGCFTIDGIQGGECGILLLDFSNTDGLGFVGELARLLLALSRGCYGIVCFGNSVAIDASYEGHRKKQFQRTGFYRLLSWCKKNNLYINLQSKKHQDLAELMNAPGDIVNAVSRIHTQRSRGTTPYNYSEDRAHNIGGVRFPKASRASGDWGGSGDNASAFGTGGWANCDDNAPAADSNDTPAADYNDTPAAGYNYSYGNDDYGPLMGSTRESGGDIDSGNEEASSEGNAGDEDGEYSGGDHSEYSGEDDGEEGGENDGEDDGDDYNF